MQLRARWELDHPSLLHGGDVPARVASLCAGAGQAPPAEAGEIVRSILMSRACKYRLVLEQLQVADWPSCAARARGRWRQAQRAAVPGRELVGAATPMTRYEPSAGQPGDETYDRFLTVTGLGSQRPAHVEV